MILGGTPKTRILRRAAMIIPSSVMKPYKSGCHPCRWKGTQNRIIGLICPFVPRAFLISVHPSGRWMVGAVGIELKATLKIRKLLVPLNEKNAKNTGFAQVRYTLGTRSHMGKLSG
ncbi:MAG: hypothetical protein WA660_03900, partial [Candidatus Acidiferrales bacterium]